MKNIVNMLLATEIVDPSAIDKVTLETPLMVAAKHGDALGVECLIKHAKVDVNDERTGRTALIRACGCGDVAAPAVEKAFTVGRGRDIRRDASKKRRLLKSRKLMTPRCTPRFDRNLTRRFSSRSLLSTKTSSTLNLPIKTA